jgi:hypothetical protein
MHFKVKIELFLTFIIINSLVQTLQFVETLILYIFPHENMKKTSTKVGYFSKIAEIFSNTKNDPVFPDG